MKKSILFFVGYFLLTTLPAWGQGSLVKTTATLRRNAATQAARLERIQTSGIVSRTRPLSPVMRTLLKNTSIRPSITIALKQVTKLLESVELRKPLLQMPVLQPFEQFSGRFIFRVSSLDGTQTASGFVFVEEYEGKQMLWGVSDATSVRAMGKDVNISFYFNGKTFTYPTKIVLKGRTHATDAALIAIPPGALEVARPVLWAKESPKKGEELFSFGYTGKDYQKARRTVHSIGTERLLAAPKKWAPAGTGAQGSLVVNERGEAVGLFLGNSTPLEVSGETKAMAEILPASRIQDLLRELRDPQSADRVILFFGDWIGKLAPNEFIEEISVRYRSGRKVTLPYSPDMDIAYLEKLFTGRPQDFYTVDIRINRPGRTSYGYRLNVGTSKVTRLELMP